MKSRRAKVLHKAGGRTLVEHVVRTALQVTPPERVFLPGTAHPRSVSRIADVGRSEAREILQCG